MNVNNGRPPLALELELETGDASGISRILPSVLGSRGLTLAKPNRIGARARAFETFALEGLEAFAIGSRESGCMGEEYG